MKKIVSLCLAIVLIFSCFAFIGCIEKNPKDDVKTPQKQYNYVVLGDSIAEGILGASPISEKNDYTYCGILGQINNFNYHNRAISGYQTFQMLDYISKEEDQSAYAHITHIKQADIISISMSGNDYIYKGLNRLVLEAVQGKSELRDSILVQVRKNVALIVARLKELNPNATIMWQSLYNPVYWDSPLLNAETYKILKEQYNVSEDELYNWGKYLLDQLNQILYDYLEENPNAFVIPDVNAKFQALYEADHENIKRLIYNDGIHPSNYGHSVIASVLQAKLEELGYAKKDSLSAYKQLCSNRLDRMFRDTDVELEKVKANINASKSFDEVNTAYFYSTENTTPNYNRPQNLKGEGKDKVILKEDTVFSLVNAVIDGGELKDLPIMGVIDKERSNLKLGSDGMLTLEVFIDPFTYGLAKSALEGMDASSVDLAWLDIYATELFPGKTMKDMESLLKSIENTLGIKINGLDFESDNVKAICEALATTGRLPEKVVLPEEISFTFTQPYELIHVDSEFSDEGFTAVYVGNYRGNEPYFMMTLSEDVWQTKTLKTRIEFMFLEIELISLSMDD